MEIISRKNTIYLISATLLSLIFTIMMPLKLLGETNELIRLIAGLFLLIFVIIHGLERYGYEKLVLFMCVSVLISFSFETLSIKTGFPFGHFYYTELLGPKIGEVPATILPAYGLTGYLAWNMGTLLVKNTSRGIKKHQFILIPVIAAVIMVLWNLCFDPIFSTIDGKWLWENGGAYYGVPISNFLGWFITNYLIFQITALFLYKYGNTQTMKCSNWFWYLVPIMYFIQGIPYLMYPFVEHTDMHIYNAMFFVTLGTMGVVSLVNIFLVKRQLKNIKIVELYKKDI